MAKFILIIILVVSLAGIIDSSYALYQHYSPEELSRCDFSETISCTAVNRSEYSALFGVPVAGIGAAGYILFASLAGAGLMRWLTKGLIFQLLVPIALIALGVSLWLTYVEIFILKAVCPLCVVSLALVTSIFVLSGVGFWKNLAPERPDVASSV